MAHFWRNLIQVSLVTPDELATIQSLQEALNLGAFKLWKFHSPVLFDTTLRDRAEPWTMQLAVTWIGDTQLEVIQPTGGTNLYQKYLDWKKGAGIEHISIDPAGRSYDSMAHDLSALGYPLVQQAKLNAPVQIAGLTLPVPGFMANLMPTRFGYTDTFDVLKISLEAPAYPPGVNPRMGVRLGAPDVWVGRERAPFEQLPVDSLITAISGVVASHAQPRRPLACLPKISGQAFARRVRTAFPIPPTANPRPSSAPRSTFQRLHSRSSSPTIPTASTPNCSPAAARAPSLYVSPGAPQPLPRSPSISLPKDGRFIPPCKAKPNRSNFGRIPPSPSRSKFHLPIEPRTP